jgi:hypothetical protein
MLTQALRRAAAELAKLAEIPDSKVDQFWEVEGRGFSGFTEILRRAAAELAKLSGIPDSKVDKFTEEFDTEIFERWHLQARCVIQTPGIADVFDAVSDAANHLRRVLQPFETFNWRDSMEYVSNFPPLKPWKKEAVLFHTVPHLIEGLRSSNARSIPDLLADLAPLSKIAKKTKEIEIAFLTKTFLTKDEMDAEKRAGRPTGIKNYPGLEVLVLELERSACFLGGGFHLNKRDRKGSLLDALDFLRAVFMSGPQMRPWGMLLPPSDRHPVSTYQRILNAARRLANDPEDAARRLAGLA